MEQKRAKNKSRKKATFFDFDSPFFDFSPPFLYHGLPQERCVYFFVKYLIYIILTIYHHCGFVPFFEKMEQVFYVVAGVVTIRVPKIRSAINSPRGTTCATLSTAQRG
jgi:hypothetical protein